MESVIRVLDRASHLISLLGAQPGRTWELGALARAAALPPATCARLLQSLVALGWADQDGARGAYRLGPRPFALATGQPYRGGLLRAVLPAMQAIARRHEAMVVLSALHDGRRRILWLCGPVAGGQPLDEHDDLYATASGRCLLAALPARARRRLLDRLGPPPPRLWKGLLDRSELDQALAQIRREGLVVLDPPGKGLHTCAAAVPDGDGGHVALGAYVPLARRDPALGAAVLAAARRR